MSTAVANEARRYSPEDLLAMPDGKSFELVRGRLLERKIGAESSEVGGILYLHLSLFNREHDMGKVWPADNGFQCFRHAPGMVRKPDVSFVKKGRLPGNVSPIGWIRIAPDLAVEVVSPNDIAEELEEKLDDYRKAEVPLIWVIYPRRRKARIHRLDGTSSERNEDGILSGEDVLPGFRCPLNEILPKLPPAEEPPANAPNGPAST